MRLPFGNWIGGLMALYIVCCLGCSAGEDPTGQPPEAGTAEPAPQSVPQALRSAGQHDADGHPEKDVPVPPGLQWSYIPMDIGCQWTYTLRTNGQDYPMTVRITNHEKLGGVLCARFDVTLDDQTASEHLGVTKEGVFRFAYKGFDVEPPVLMFPRQFEQGKSWEGGHRVVAGGLMATRRWTVLAVDEPVEVPAGKFSTVVIRGVNPNATNWINTKYYARGVGMVKEMNVQEGVSSETVLVKFTPATKP